MIEEVYDKGDEPKVRKVFQDSTGAYFDPLTVNFYVKPPSNLISQYVYGTDPQIVKESTGIYYIKIDANAEGIWWWRWEALNPQQAEENSFLVKPSQFS